MVPGYIIYRTVTQYEKCKYKKIKAQKKLRQLEIVEKKENVSVKRKHLMIILCE